MFDIGTELEGTATQTSNWLNVISDVKSIYSGKLTYSANCGSPAIQTPVGFGNSLDYIGIDAYYTLTSQNDPSLVGPAIGLDQPGQQHQLLVEWPAGQPAEARPVYRSRLLQPAGDEYRALESEL